MSRFIVVALVLAGVVAWLVTSPASYHEVGEVRIVGEPPREVVSADAGDVIAEYLVTVAARKLAYSPVSPTGSKMVPGSDKLA